MANHLSASHEILVKYYNKRTASQEILFVYFEIYILLLFGEAFNIVNWAVFART